jgi:uncharacterized SAM-binding protein YcdF (DUF218 family)
LLLCVVIGLAVRRLRPLAEFGAAAYAVILLVPVEQVVLRPLEDRFPRPAPPSRVDGILVLGGAVDEVLTADRRIPSLNEAAERMTEAVALSLRYPGARIVFSGGSGRLISGQMTESDAAKLLLIELGVDSTRLTFEAGSRNTWENAGLTEQAVRPVAGSVWLLVTSASHMPRAVGVFRHLGWPVVPWPVGYKTAREPRAWFEASLPERLERIDWGVHEWVGLIIYRVLGRTDALFPGPAEPKESE